MAATVAQFARDEIQPATADINAKKPGVLPGLLRKAAELGANTFQIFSSSPRQWKASVPSVPAIRLLNQAREKHDLYPLAIHDNYLINLASAHEKTREMSIEAFIASTVLS